MIDLDAFEKEAREAFEGSMQDAHSKRIFSELTQLIAFARAAADSLPKIKEGAPAPASQAAAPAAEPLRKALERIARWHGEFPATGRFWPDGSPTSYGVEFGSNGERDYMRQIAVEALAGAAPVEAASPWQQIETLPKSPVFSTNGHEYAKYVLASDGYNVVRGRWWQHVSGSSNFLQDGGAAFYPTHWMEIPAAPAPEAQ